MNESLAKLLLSSNLFFNYKLAHSCLPYLYKRSLPPSPLPCIRSSSIIRGLPISIFVSRFSLCSSSWNSFRVGEIMAAVTFAEEFSSSIPAPRMFKALILDGDNLIPKLMPQAIKNIELVQGDGGPGSIRQMNFAEGQSLVIFLSLVTVLELPQHNFLSLENNPRSQSPQRNRVFW